MWSVYMLRGIEPGRDSHACTECRAAVQEWAQQEERASTAIATPAVCTRSTSCPNAGPR